MKKERLNDFISKMIENDFIIVRKPEAEININESNLHLHIEENVIKPDFILINKKTNSIAEVFTDENNMVEHAACISNISFNSNDDNSNNIQGFVDMADINYVAFKGETFSGSIQKNLLKDFNKFFAGLNQEGVTHNKIPFEKNTFDMLLSMKDKTNIDYQMQAHLNGLTNSKPLEIVDFKVYYDKQKTFKMK